MNHLRQTGTFAARSEFGREYTIHIFTEFSDVRARAAPTAIVGGRQELRTPEGLVVTRLAQGEYQVAQTGVRLRSDDPDAP